MISNFLPKVLEVVEGLLDAYPTCLGPIAMDSSKKKRKKNMHHM